MSHNELAKALRDAAKSPDSWDVQGLLYDAADAIGNVAYVLKDAAHSIRTGSCYDPAFRANLLRAMDHAILQVDTPYVSTTDATATSEPRAANFLRRLLNPEDLGYAVPAHVRDDVREVLGMERVEHATLS
jgi:hypothetical protein